MQPRSRIFLIVGLALLVPGLGVLGFGIYGVMHTAENVATHRRALESIRSEANDLGRKPRTPQNVRRIRELDDSHQRWSSALAEYEGYQTGAILILAAGGVLTLAGVVLLLVHVVRGRGAERDADEEAEDDEEEEDERRYRRRRRRRDPDDWE